jgi:hypothetical protein
VALANRSDPAVLLHLTLRRGKRARELPSEGRHAKRATCTWPLVALAERDRRAALAVLENAQFVYALSRYPKKQVLDDPVDVRALRERLEAMRKAIGELSAAQRKEVDVPLRELDDIDSGTEAVWRAAKRVTPKVIAKLSPLVHGTPEAAFLITPETRPATSAKAAPRKRSRRRSS